MPPNPRTVAPIMTRPPTSGAPFVRFDEVSKVDEADIVVALVPASRALKHCQLKTGMIQSPPEGTKTCGGERCIKRARAFR